MRETTTRTINEGEERVIEDHTTKQDHIIITVGNQHHDVTVDRTHLDMVGAYVTTMATTNINTEEEETDIDNNTHEILTNTHIIADNSTQDMTEAHLVTDNTDVMMQAHIITENNTQAHIINNTTTQSFTQGHTLTNNTIQGHINIMEEDRQVNTLETHTHIPTVPPESQGSNVGGKQTPSVVVLKVMDSYTRSLPQQNNHSGIMLSPQHYHSVTGLLPSPQHHQITSFSDMSLSPPGIVDDLVTININNINNTLTSGHLGDLHNDSLGDPISDSMCVNNSSSDTLVSHHHQVLDTQTTLASTSNSLTSPHEHHILDTSSSLIPQHIIATPSSGSVNSHHNVISVSPCTCHIMDTNLPNLSTCSCEESNDGFLNCGDVESPGFARDSLSINDGGCGDSSREIGSNSELVSAISNISNEPGLCTTKKIHRRKSDCIMVKVKETDAHCTLPTVPTDTVLISRELDDGKCVRYGTIRVVETGKGATLAGSKNRSNSSIMVSRKRKPVLDIVASKSCSSDILIKRHIGGDPTTNGEDFVTIDGRRLLAEHTNQTTQNEEKNEEKDERQHFYSCCLCGNVIAQRNKPTLIPRNSVFPLSSLHLISLLKNLGVCPSSLDNSTDTSTNTDDIESSDGGSFTLCLWCHSLVLEADGVYAQVMSLTARVRHQWLKDGSKSEALMHLSQLNIDTTHGIARTLKRRNQDILGTKMSDRRLNRMKGNGPGGLRKCRNSQTTTLPTPDVLTDDRQVPVVSPMRESEGITSATTTTTTIKQELSNKMLICGFCGMDLYGDDEFRLHSAAVHRIRPTWQQWANQQSVLKTRLAKEIQRSDPSGRNRDSGRRGGGGGGGRESSRKCTACGREYPVREEFVEHLRQYHNMTIDEQFLEFVAEESTDSVSKRTWSGGGGGGCQDQGFNKAWSSSSSSSCGGSYQETSSGINKDQTNGRTEQVGSVTGTISIIKCEPTRPDDEVSSKQDGPLEVKGSPEDKATKPTTTIKVEKDHSSLRKQDCVTGNRLYISQTTNRICISPSKLTPNRVTTSEIPMSKTNAISKLSHSPSSIVPEASVNVMAIPPSTTTTSPPGSKHRQWRCRLCSLLFTSQEQHDRHKLLVHPEAVRVGRCRVSVEKDGTLAFLSKVADKNKVLLSKVKNTSQGVFFSKVETKGQPTFLGNGKVNNSPPKFIKAIGSVSCKLCGTEVEEEEEEEGSKHRILCGTCQENSVVMFEGDNRDGFKQDQIEILKGDITEDEGVKELETLLVEKRIDGEEEDVPEELEEGECVSVVEMESGKKSPQVDTKFIGVAGRNLECSTCGEIFTHRPLLLEHKRSVHSVTNGGNGSVGKVECEICGWKLQSVTSLRLHLAKVHHHRSTHKLPLRHRCKLCIFQCRTRTQLERHMQEKHGASALPPVRCTQCGKTYNAKYIEKHFANMHENLKKYACNFCSMKYNLETALKSHIFYEHRNNKWRCEVCQVEFDRYHQLRQHRTYVHSTKVYPCRECERSFKRKGDLTEHIKRRHQARIPNKCIHCTKVYSDRKKLRTHLMTKHGVAWEDTLARTYARHQRESNCFRRKPGLTTTTTTTTRQTHHQHHQNQNTSLGPTTDYTEGPQEDNPGPVGGYSEILEVPRKDGMETDETSMTTYEEATTSLVVDGGEHQYNVVHVTEDTQHHLSHMANFSYIILEET
ncbi:hypothetical protein Pmani_008085 [Petrolisthes manimaculis]|uniref:C2H2-type domain-containing protein n=1 Tax=Petrolisthes manimaculis TaxID=1843537 RepID=A0AAE1Q7I1_9EUCA|nr:hypothetical protein Pmani_008085 [Petrolisthes manimaculis]